MLKNIKISSAVNPDVDCTLLKDAIEKYVETHKKEGMPMLGALDHPLNVIDHSDNSILPRISDISCKINDIKFDNVKIPVLTFDADILDTPNGKIVQDILKDERKVRMAPRMIYNPEGNGYQIMSIGVFPEKTNNEIQHDRVLRFIRHFSSDENKTLFTKKCSYWFADMLYNRFKMDACDVYIMYNSEIKRFSCMVNNVLYDINGVIHNTDKWEEWRKDIDNYDNIMQEDILKDCYYYKK